ncbi:MAG: TetR/AcrR family transcriptional regulator [Ruminococcaceae bacterium]|nr:TetR/AcrR family transcriptional regulator [Oscillospiraceae bacterium]
MILKGTEDLRVQKTIEAIKNTFEELICEKDYEKITVKELCDRARINKKTFYTYYPALDDLLGELQMEISGAYIEQIKDFRLPEDIDKLTRAFFEYSNAQGRAYEKITVSGSYNYIRQKMINNVKKETWSKSAKFNKMDEFFRNILLEHVNTTTINIYKEWVEKGKKQPLEEVIDLSIKLICGGVNEFLKNT